MITAKLYKISEDYDLMELGKKLEKYDKTEIGVTDDGKKIKLRTNVENIKLDKNKNKIRGIINVDYIGWKNYRGEKEYFPVNVFSEFYIKRYGESYFLFVFKNIKVAQIVEKKLNDIMFGVPGTISGCNLTSEQIHIIMGGCEGEIYHRSSWENLDLRNISKSDISGPNIKDTDDYEKYDSHGDMSYTLFRSKKYDNCVFGVSKLGVVFTPNKKDQAFLIRVITEQVLPLL